MASSRARPPTTWALTGNEDDPGAWGVWVTGNGTARNAAQYLFQDNTVKYYLARNPAQDSLAYDWESNLDRLYSMAALNDATNTDLHPFKNSNAKLILWHGGNDPALSPNATAAFYKAVTDAAGGQAATDEFVRFCPGSITAKGAQAQTRPTCSAHWMPGLQTARHRGCSPRRGLPAVSPRPAGPSAVFRNIRAIPDRPMTPLPRLWPQTKRVRLPDQTAAEAHHVNKSTAYVRQ